MGTEAANRAFSAYVGLDEPKPTKKSKAAKAEEEAEILADMEREADEQAEASSDE